MGRMGSPSKAEGRTPAEVQSRPPASCRRRAKPVAMRSTHSAIGLGASARPMAAQG